MPEFLNSFKSRKSIAAFLLVPEGQVAGMLVRSGPAGYVLRDSTGELPIASETVQALGLEAPCWLALRWPTSGQAQLDFFLPIQADAALERGLAQSAVWHQRLRIRQAIRSFFLSQGFLEVDSPVAVVNPGSEPFLDTFAVGPLWLRTSPELHMKQLLGLGFESIFQMGPCFRKGDVGRMHSEEFTMLEWYRCFASLDQIAADVAGLLQYLAPLSVDPDYFRSEPEQATCSELFVQYLQLELHDHSDVRPLRVALAQRGIETLDEDSWDTLYFLLFLNFIEPHLGKDRPLLVTHFPASQAALSKLVPPRAGQMPSCYRMELYLRGLELANGFYELTDACEQRARMVADNQFRQSMGKPGYALDEPFLSALARGLPPCAGIALGVERLVASLLGQASLAALSPFSAGVDGSGDCEERA